MIVVDSFFNAVFSVSCIFSIEHTLDLQVNPRSGEYTYSSECYDVNLL